MTVPAPQAVYWAIIEGAGSTPRAMIAQQSRSKSEVARNSHTRPPPWRPTAGCYSAPPASTSAVPPEAGATTAPAPSHRAAPGDLPAPGKLDARSHGA